MINLEINTRVIHKKSDDKGVIVGKNTNGDYRVLRDGQATSETWYEHNTLPFKMTTKDLLQKKTDRYMFHSSCLVDVDFTLIKSELTKKNPLALVSVGDRRFIVLHNSLRAKAALCRVPLQGAAVDKTKDIFETKMQFSEWIKWAKDVKSAPWPEAVRAKTTVKVSLPKI